MGRPKGSKNKEKARTGKARVRCSKCRKRGYLGEMTVIQGGNYWTRRHEMRHRHGVKNSTKHYKGIYLCGDCSQIKLST